MKAFSWRFAWQGRELYGLARESFAYTAREFESETNLYYYRARYFDSSIGRFLSEDGVGNDKGLNLYVYVDNSPIDSRDPTGFYKLVGFPADKIGDMNNAINNPISDLKADCPSCAGPNGPKIADALQNATHALSYFVDLDLPKLGLDAAERSDRRKIGRASCAHPEARPGSTGQRTMIYSDELLAVAKRIFCFGTPEEALEFPIRFLTYAMTYASDEDIEILRKYFSDDEFKAALDDPAPRICARFQHRRPAFRLDRHGGFDLCQSPLCERISGTAHSSRHPAVCCTL